MDPTTPPTSLPAKVIEGTGPAVSGAGTIADTEKIKNKKDLEQEQQPAEASEPNPPEVAPVTPVLRYALKHRDGSNPCRTALPRLDSDKNPSPLLTITASLLLRCRP
jgi:hypothetical protein